jgi:diguanylate cyclase (GGDEF)-like protein
MNPKTADLIATLVVCIGVSAVLLNPSASAVVAGGSAAAMGLLYLLLRRYGHSRSQQLERLAEEHKLLRESIETNPMPFAVYDRADRLIAWNQAYENLYQQAFELLQNRRRSGEIYYSDLIRVIAEQTMSAEQIEDYVAKRVAQQREAAGVAIDREYPEFGWVRVSKFITPSGAVAGFAIDINELKQKEAELRQQIERSRALEVELRIVADTDSLTRLANRRAFLIRATTEFHRFRRYHNDFCVAMMDIDSFKSINDSYGHNTGDEVIIKITELAAKMLREGIDFFGRLGGEEFAILLPQTDLEGALSSAERIRQTIEAYEFIFENRSYNVTISLGVTQLDATDKSFSEALNRADRALYEAKNLGRNRVSAMTVEAASARRPEQLTPEIYREPIVANRLPKK